MPLALNPAECTLNLGQVATKCGVNVTTVRRWSSRGVPDPFTYGLRVRLRVLRVGGRRKTSQAEVDRFLAAMNRDRAPDAIPSRYAEAMTEEACLIELRAMGVKI